MKKFKTSIYGYRKRNVNELLKNLQQEHEERKQALVQKMDEILSDVEQWRRKVESAQEGGRET